MRRIAHTGLAIALSIAGIAGSTAPAGAAPAWSVIGPVAGAPFGRLASVWCAGPARCFAVGAADSPTTSTRLAERWTGTSWTVVPTPSPSPSTNSQFVSVHCVTSTNCVAVGQYSYGLTTRPLVERWNGTKWSLVPSPRPAGVAVSGLASVWCASTTFCVAVGSYYSSTSDSSAEQTLIERWNGTKWSIIASPNRPTPAIDSGLVAVTCTSSTRCLAVGHSVTNLATSTLVERWNGAAWSIVASANPANTDSELSGVGCAGAGSCFAVGSGRGSLAEHWNGATWSMLTTPNPAGATGASLSGVSCPSLTQCVAAGDFFTGPVVQRLVESWNGTSWSIVATPAPTGTVRSALGGISCVTTVNCFAVGEYGLGPSRRPLILHLV